MTNATKTGSARFNIHIGIPTQPSRPLLAAVLTAMPGHWMDDPKYHSGSARCDNNRCRDEP